MSQELKMLAEYHFDTSTYSILKEGARREFETGRLIAHNSPTESSKRPSKGSSSKKIKPAHA